MAKRHNEQRHMFLLTFFNEPHNCYAEKEINGFKLVRYQDNSISPSKWRVAIYPPKNLKIKLPSPSLKHTPKKIRLKELELRIEKIERFLVVD